MGLIWGRWLWPAYRLEGFTPTTPTTPEFYRRQIRRLRREQEAYGAQLVGLDAEPYGKSPMIRLKGKDLRPTVFQAIQRAIRAAVAAEGRVDLITPEAGVRPTRLYSATVELGTLVCAQHTYYERRHFRPNPRRPFDIYGVFVQMDPDHPKYDHIRFYTPQRVLQARARWSDYQGLWVYPGVRGEAARVAEAFRRIGRGAEAKGRAP